MAMGLDVAAGIAGLITLADVVIDRTWRTIKACKNAGKDSQALLRGVQSLHGVLSGLQKLAGQVTQASLVTHVPAAEIYSCQQLLTKLRDKLLKADPNGDGIPTHKKWLRTLKWPITSDETQSVLKEIERYKSTFDLTVSMDVLESIFASSADQRKIAHGVEDVRRALEDITRIQVTAERKQVLDFYGTYDAEIAHGKNTQLRQQGTGLWLTKGSELQKWLNARNSKLWMFGIPGAGKTVLASAAIEETLCHVAQEHGIAYYYCDYKAPKSLLVPSILACLCGQLARQHEKCYEVLLKSYRPNPDEAPRAGIPPLDELTQLLLTLISYFDSVSIIVDGIDECDDRAGVAIALSKLAAKSTETSILLSSRDDQAIRPHLEDFDLLPVGARNEDLKLYVSAEIALRTEKGSLKIKSTSLKDEILERLVDGADGMFRWVACQMDHLSRLKTDAARRRALSELPPDLTTTYDRILERVNLEGDETATIVEKVLCWIYDPVDISSDELCETIAVSDGRYDKEAKPDIDTILSCCGSLVRLSGQLKLELAHFTVKEYLRSDRVRQNPMFTRYFCNEGTTKSFKAKVCLEYICLEHFRGLAMTSPGSMSSFITKSPFYRHAATSWYGYYISADRNETDLEALLRTLFIEAPTSFCTWKEVMIGMMMMMQSESGGVSSHDKKNEAAISAIASSLTQLHVAAIFRLHQLIPALAKTHDINGLSPFGTPIFCAYSLDHWRTEAGMPGVAEAIRLQPTFLLEELKQTITSLAKHGADLGYRFPFEWMTANERRDSLCATKLGDYCTPLCQSLVAGGTRELLENDAPLECHSLNGILSFCLAKHLPDEDVASLIISQHVSDDNQDLFTQIVSRLKPGRATSQDVANSNSLNSLLSGKALMAKVVVACLMDSPDDLERALGNCLIDADATVVHESGRTALHCAANALAPRTVKFLLERGADPNTVDKNGQTALDLVFSSDISDVSRAENVVDDLFNHGARVTQNYEEKATCLHEWADYDCPAQLIHLLLDRGAVLSMQNVHGHNPLHILASRDKAEKIAILSASLTGSQFLELASTVDQEGRLPIHLAAQAGSVKSFDMLRVLEYATRIWTMKALDGRSMLHYAAQGALATTLPFECVLNNIEDADVRADDGSSPIHDWVYAISRVDNLDVNADTRYLSSGNEPIAESRGKAKSSPNLVLGRGYTTMPIYNTIVIANFRTITQLLSARSVDIIGSKTNGDTPVHKICELIAEHNAETSSELSALSRLDLECFDALRTHVDNLSAKNESGLSAIDILLSSIYESTEKRSDGKLKRRYASEAAVLLLLSDDRQLDIDSLCFDGCSILSIAASVRNDELVSRLLDLGADVDCLDQVHGANCTPLQLMCKQGCSVKVVEKALRRTRNLHDRDAGANSSWSLLHLATSYFNGFSDPEVLRLLVSLGISVDIVGGDERRTPMTLAIMEEALDDVTMLLECGADPSRRDVNRRGWCPFLRACVVGNVAIARCLLSAGATWNCAEYFPDERKERNPLFGGESRSAGPLQLACIGGHYEMVEQILQWMEESIERLECSDGPSALLWASRAGAKSIVSLLIEHGLPIDAVDPVDGYTALHAASAYGNTAVAQLLMSAGCVTNITDNCLRSARMHALDGNHLHLAQILDSSLDDDRMFTSMLNQRIHATPESASFARHANARGLNSHYIIAAIERGDIETVRRMCNAGGDMSRPFSCCSCTPLLLSIYLCQYEIAMQLLEYGVDGEGSMCGKHGVQGRNIYHLAATRADALQILEKLLDSSTVNGKLKAELPVMLRLAARRGNSLALARLIDLNEAQNPQALKLKGRLPASYSFNDDVVQCGTALHFAAGWAHERAAKILLDVGAPIEEADNRMRTALHVAILTSSISIIHVLLDAGANIHAIDYAGSSALHLAVRVGPVTIVDELLKRGAEISTHDDHGLSALAIASCCRDMGVVQLLLRDGNHVQELEDTAYLVSMISGSRWAGCSLALNLGSALNGCDYLWGWEDIEASRLRKLLRRLHAPSLLRNLMASKVKLISCGHLGPLDEACDRGRIEVAVVLLEAGAFVNLECGPSGTPLLHACRAGRFGIVRILIRRGAVISYKRGSEIISALHAAKHFPEIVQWILVERFIDQQKIEKCSSTQRAKFVLRAGSSTKKSYAPATSAKEVPWDTRKVMTRTEADRFLPQKLREMSSGPFVAREDGYVERLETG